MKIDALKQYAKLRQQLLNEKRDLEARLGQINEVLRTESPAPSAPSGRQASGPTVARRGRKPRGGNNLTMREAVLNALSKGPLARNELVKAVEDTGYVFTTKNPLNSIGSILYSKNTPVKSKGGKFYLPGGAQPMQGHNGTASATVPERKKRRRMGPEARARIAAAQRARWARARASK